MKLTCFAASSKTFLHEPGIFTVSDSKEHRFLLPSHPRLRSTSAQGQKQTTSRYYYEIVLPSWTSGKGSGIFRGLGTRL